jgi:hypothetical protein
MGFLAPVAPFISAATSIAAAQQASAVGRYNQAIQNRNAQIAEQEAERIEQRKEFDLARFEEANFARMSGDLARQQARAAQFGYYAQAGTSLLKAFG